MRPRSYFLGRRYLSRPGKLDKHPTFQKKAGSNRVGFFLAQLLEKLARGQYTILKQRHKLLVLQSKIFGLRDAIAQFDAPARS